MDSGAGAGAVAESLRSHHCGERCVAFGRGPWNKGSLLWISLLYMVGKVVEEGATSTGGKGRIRRWTGASMVLLDALTERVGSSEDWEFLSAVVHIGMPWYFGMLVTSAGHYL